MIDTYRNLKKIATIDGKYYISKDIQSINETKDNIELYMYGVAYKGLDY